MNWMVWFLLVKNVGDGCQVLQRVCIRPMPERCVTPVTDTDRWRWISLQQAGRILATGLLLKQKQGGKKKAFASCWGQSYGAWWLWRCLYMLNDIQQMKGKCDWTAFPPGLNIKASPTGNIVNLPRLPPQWGTRSTMRKNGPSARGL